MANIRVDLDSPIDDGQEVIFKSPIDCSKVTGLKVYYPKNSTTTASKTFQFADAHGNNVGSIDLFAADVLVKVILDTTSLKAFVQNPDTNKYLEDKFKSLGNSLGSHASQHKTGGADPLTAADVGAINQTAVYYGSTDNKDADTLDVGLAIVSNKTTLNPELYNIFGTFAYVLTYHGTENKSSKLQIAFDYYPNRNNIATRSFRNGTWGKWVSFATTDYALPLNGSQPMTGNLSISKILPRVLIKNTTLGNSGLPAGFLLEQSSKGLTYLCTCNDVTDETTMTSNYRGLVLHSALSAGSVENALQFHEVVAGARTSYNVLHTGNKNLIKPADIGAYDITTKGTAIPKDSDLNSDTYKVPGIYYSSGSSISASLSNCPVTESGFKLVVETGYVSTYALQTIIYGSSGKKFYRQFYGSAWSDWRAVATQDYVTDNFLQLSGGTLSGILDFLKVSNNGLFRINKNHNAEVDYGTFMTDRGVSEDGSTKEISLRLRGRNQTAQINIDDDYHNILHTGNYKDTVTPTNIGAAPTTHNHSASNITSGTLPIERGGTGGATVDKILKNFFPLTKTPVYIPTFGSSYLDNGYCNVQSLRNTMGLGNTTGALPIANGGTGQTTAPNSLYALINGSTALGATDIATGDYIPVGDISGATGKKITLANLAAALKVSNIVETSWTGQGGWRRNIAIPSETKMLVITGDSTGAGVHQLLGPVILYPEQTTGVVPYHSVDPENNADTKLGGYAIDVSFSGTTCTVEDAYDSTNTCGLDKNNVKYKCFAFV